MTRKAVPTTSDSGHSVTPSHKENVVMDFAYKADLIFEVMVSQRREPKVFEPKVADEKQRCSRCNGTGRYITGTLNGKPVGPGGICYRCAGKGFQTIEDGKRNWVYDNYYMRVSL